VTVRKTLDHFYDSLMVLAALAMVSAFVVVILGIADRQFAFGLRGLDSYAGYAIAAALFLALPGTLKRGEHIRVTLLLQRFSTRWQGVLEAWCLLAGVALTSALAWYACRLVWLSHSTNDISQGSDASPLWIPQLAMALGCVGLAVAFIDAAVSRIVGKTFYDDAGSEAAHIE